MATGIERYPSGPIERYPSDVLVSLEADDALVRESSMDMLCREFGIDPLPQEMSLDPLYRNDSINPDISLGFASGYPEGGNYVVTRDSRAFTDSSVGEVAISTISFAEMMPEDDVEGRLGAPVVQLDDGDFAKDVVAPVANMNDSGVHIESGVNLSDTHFAGTDGVNEVDPLLDTIVSDTISGVPTPERSHEVIGHLEKAGIFPKIIDRFTPTTSVRAVFNNNLEVRNGMEVMASAMSKPPLIEIEGAFVMPGSLYTIMLISDEQDGEHMHWLHVNYQGPQDIASAVARAGADLVHYEAPVAGMKSRMVFLLFRQKERLVAPVAHAEDKVSARSFTTKYRLTPVGAVYMRWLHRSNVHVPANCGY